MAENRLTAKRLVKEWQAGNNREENFQSLFERYSRPVSHFFKNRGFSNEECRDLTQETFLGVYRGMDNFQLNSSVETWIFRIARNLWSNTIRNRTRKKRAGKEVSLEESLAPASSLPVQAGAGPILTHDSVGPLNEVLVEERLRWLRDAVAQLPKLYQELIFLRYDQELKYREISQLLKMPEGTVKSTLSRAQELLKEILGADHAGLDFES